MGNRKVRQKLNTVILLSGFLLYACFNLFLLLRHQPYRDEANVWLMAKYLSPVSLIREIHYQGHPCLWYLLVMPFAAAGLPYRTIEVLSFLVMMATAGIFLLKADVSPVVKLLCLASPFFTYFYPVIARNYCLIALLMMLCAWLYPKRDERPLIYGALLGLLVQADTIAIATAGALSFAWLIENALRSWRQRSRTCILNAARGLWIPLASLLFWVYQMRGVSDCQAYGIKWQGAAVLLSDMRNYAWKILERLTGWSVPVIIVFALLFLGALLSIAHVTGDVIPLFVMLMTYLFQVVFSAMVYELHIWHFLSLGFVMLWMLWIQGRGPKGSGVRAGKGKAAFLLADLLVIALAVSMILHWNSAEETSSLDRALHMPYSDGYNAACFVKDNIDVDALIFTTDVAMSSSILAYLDGYQFIYAGSGQPVTYADWSAEQLKTISLDALDAWAWQNFSDRQEYYVIQTAASCLKDADALKQLQPVYQTAEKTTKNENYTIYRIQRN